MLMLLFHQKITANDFTAICNTLVLSSHRFQLAQFMDKLSVYPFSNAKWIRLVNLPLEFRSIGSDRGKFGSSELF